MFSVFIVMIGSLGLLLSFSICTHSLVSFKIPSSRIAGRNHFSRLDMSGRKDENDQAINPTPISILKSYQNFGSNSIRAATILASSLLSVYSKTSPISLPVQSANAIGTLAELQNQACVLQDISFNVYDCNVEATAISALTLNTYQALSTVGGADGLTRIVAGFGPNGYVSPPTFYPGISSFFEDGGHATITYQQRPNADTLAVPGNGLQYVKLATEQLRLSKGIENGLTVLYAYGWVDLQSPSGVPYQVVVGIARDPLMMVCLQVSDLPSSVEYFRAQLGMSEQPFPLARAEESQYEVKQPKGSVHMGYGPIGFSVLLVPLPEADEGWLKFFKQKKKVTVLPEVAVGNVLNTFTIVFDDSVTESLPALYKEIIDDQKKDPAVRTTVSPDGYKFKLLPYSEYVKSIKK